MSITLVKEDGTGLANANAYASAADDDTYHAADLGLGILLDIGCCPSRLFSLKNH
jgi:hypothetical protein